VGRGWGYDALNNEKKKKEIRVLQTLKSQLQILIILQII
jgi:hypothetical protein